MYPIIDFGTLHIPTFFLVISLSLSGLLVALSKRVDLFLKDRKAAYDIAIIIMLSGFLGGRIMHIVFEEWEYYAMQPSRMIEFWNGGFVYFGGLISSFLACIAYCKIKKLKFLDWADFFTPLLSLSHAFGRIGCLLSGCCFGVACDLPWALDGRHPTVLYLFFGEIAILFVLLGYEQAKHKMPSGHLFAKWILLHSVLRLNVEYFRNDYRGDFYNIPPFGQISISQIISLIFIVISTSFFVSESRKRAKHLVPPPPPV